MAEWIREPGWEREGWLTPAREPARELDPLSEVGPIRQLVLKHPRDAFVGPEVIAGQWRDLNFSDAPEFPRAIREYEALLALLADLDADVRFLPEAPGTSLDSLYVRDAAILSPAGVILAAMGKARRATEPAAQEEAYRAWQWPVIGAIQPPGRLEGGDVIWLDARTVVVGLGYRTNLEGVEQFRQLLGPAVTCETVPLPHWRGPDDVFHLMSILSPVDRDLAVVYSPLMPVPLRNQLLDRGYRLVEVPDEEFASMGANVLALAPRRCVMVEGNPQSRRLLEAAGADVQVYAGTEISVKGGGGPTCLTRPIRRGAA
jgi:N-dimethylarginine dimethylaminohydrolase